MGIVVDHPAAALMAEVEAERAIDETPEAAALHDAIFKAVSDYWAYLDRHGLIYDCERQVMRASVLRVTHSDLGSEIVLEGGAIHRRYGDSKDDAIFALDDVEAAASFRDSKDPSPD